MNRTDALQSLTAVLLCALLLLLAGEAAARAKNGVVAYFFWGRGCPHCNEEENFLARMKERHPGLEIRSYEVWYNLENAGLFAQMAKAYGTKPEGVPTLFIGEYAPVVGYLGDQVTGESIEAKIVSCMSRGCIDPIEKVRGPSIQEPSQKAKPGEQRAEPSAPKKPETETVPPQATEEKVPRGESEKHAEEKTPVSPAEPVGVRIPLIGFVDTAHTSLPLLTVLIAGMDGFNPCAFFVLFLLLSILVYARSRKIMLLIGGTFVFFSGLIYFLFMSAWLNVFLLLGEIRLITAGAGLVAVIIAIVNIKDFFLFRKGVSLAIPETAKPKLFRRTRDLLKKESLPSMMFGTVVLAVVANSYELLCTAGFPMVYTRALTLHHLPPLQYYLYLVLYNVIYVIPLAVIVVIFSVTLGARKLTEWQGQVMKLLSGFMMLSLGLVLLARPSLLNNIFLSAGLLLFSVAAAAIIALLSGKSRKTGE